MKMTVATRAAAARQHLLEKALHKDAGKPIPAVHKQPPTEVFIDANPQQEYAQSTRSYSAAKYDGNGKASDVLPQAEVSPSSSKQLLAIVIPTLACNNVIQANKDPAAHRYNEDDATPPQSLSISSSASNNSLDTLIHWFSNEPHLPTTAFYLNQGEHIPNPKRFYGSLKRDIEGLPITGTLGKECLKRRLLKLKKVVDSRQ
jgi:hypothetical protein